MHTHNREPVPDSRGGLICERLVQSAQELRLDSACACTGAASKECLRGFCRVTRLETKYASRRDSSNTCAGSAIRAEHRVICLDVPVELV